MHHFLKKFIDKYRNFNPLIKFGLNLIGLLSLWLIFYQFFRYSEFIHSFYESATSNLTSILLQISKKVLEFLGFEVELIGKVIRISGTSGVHLDRGCLGRNLMGLFAGFILAYPGKIKHKIWFIPFGLLIINILNVIRICGLTYVVQCCPEHLDINHHVVFKYTVYFFIFLLWYFWIKNYSISASKKVSVAKNQKITHQKSE